MRILVTGGMGFVGSHLVKRLFDIAFSNPPPDDILVFDNFSNPCIDLNDFMDEGAISVDVVRGDVLDALSLKVACEDVDMIYHLAVGQLLQSLEDPLTVHRINAEGTLNVCEAAREHDLKLVYVSSCEVYGNTTQYPTPEAAQTNPTTIYGASKLAGEKYVQAYHSLYGIPAVIVRPFNCYGPRKRGKYLDVITRFIKEVINDPLNPLEIHGDGKQTRDFTHVSDVVEGIVLASRLKDCEIVNVASGRETSINELARIIGRHVPPYEHIGDRLGQNRRMWGDISKAKRLGFGPKIKLEDGVRKLAHQIK